MNYYIKNLTNDTYYSASRYKFTSNRKNRSILKKEYLQKRFKMYCRIKIFGAIQEEYSSNEDKTLHRQDLDKLLNHEFAFLIEGSDTLHDSLDTRKIIKNIDINDIREISGGINRVMFKDIIHNKKLGRYFKTKDFLKDPGEVYGLDRDQGNNDFSGRNSYYKHFETKDEEVMFRLSADLSQLEEIDPKPMLSVVTLLRNL